MFLPKKSQGVANAAESNPVQLLLLARQGDGDALGQLLEMYRNNLTLLARLQVSRRLQSKAGSADLVQETFLKAHQRFAQFPGSSWLRSRIRPPFTGRKIRD